MECRLLESEHELVSYRALLYRNYIEENGWSVAPRNAVGLNVAQSPDNRSILCDRFDSVAHVFGVVDDSGRVLTGLRVVEPLEGRLELDVLHSLPQRFKASYLRRFELGRLVVAQGQDSGDLLRRLFRTVAQFLKSQECDILFVSAIEPEYAALFRRLGFVSADQAVFRPVFAGAPLARLLHLDCRVSGALDPFVMGVKESEAA